MGRKKSRRNKQKRNPDSDTPPIVEELEGAGLEVLDAIEGVVEFMNTKECIFKAVFESADWYQTLFSSPRCVNSATIPPFTDEDLKMCYPHQCTALA